MRPDGGFTAARPTPKGITGRTRNAETTISTGAIRWTQLSAECGTMSSFVTSLIASAIGWSSPNGPTRFGPIRSWNRPAIFRSASTM